MKAHLYDLNGKSKGEVTLPHVFDSPIRKDIVQKTFESSRIFQPHSLDPEAGRKHSAAGTISHKRHDWKGHYGKGMSRIPRKIMWRRGIQFNWVGAEVSGTRGGRRVHGPKLIRRQKMINAKEEAYAFNSAIAATAHQQLVKQRYARLASSSLNVPFVIDLSKQPKMKEWRAFIDAVLGSNSEVALQAKVVRAGVGKLRGRKYKTSAGLLLVIGSKEKISLKGIDIRSVSNLTIADLYPLGRLTVYTQKALEELAK